MINPLRLVANVASYLLDTTFKPDYKAIALERIADELGIMNALLRADVTPSPTGIPFQDGFPYTIHEAIRDYESATANSECKQDLCNICLPEEESPWTPQSLSE